MFVQVVELNPPYNRPPGYPRDDKFLHERIIDAQQADDSRLYHVGPDGYRRVNVGGEDIEAMENGGVGIIRFQPRSRNPVLELIRRWSSIPTEDDERILPGKKTIIPIEMNELWTQDSGRRVPVISIHNVVVVQSPASSF